MKRLQFCQKGDKHSPSALQQTSITGYKKNNEAGERCLKLLLDEDRSGNRFSHGVTEKEFQAHTHEISSSSGKIQQPLEKAADWQRRFPALGW